MFQKKEKKYGKYNVVLFSHRSSSEVRIRNWNMLPESIAADIHQEYEVDPYKSNKE